MGISAPVPAVWFRPAPDIACREPRIRNLVEAVRSAQARPNTELVAMLIKNQEENHG